MSDAARIPEVSSNDKIGRNSVNSPPDFIVEIMNPSNSGREFFYKLQYYLEAGVREYWMIDPEIKKVLVHVYKDGHYISTSYKENACIPVAVLPGLEINL